MSAENSELTPPRSSAIPDWFWQLVALGGGAVAVMGALGGIDAGFERAAPVLHTLGTKPVGLWTIQFLIESVFGALALILGEILNKVAIIGAIVGGVGYFMHANSKTRASGQPQSAEKSASAQ